MTFRFREPLARPKFLESTHLWACWTWPTVRRMPVEPAARGSLVRSLTSGYLWRVPFPRLLSRGPIEATGSSACWAWRSLFPRRAVVLAGPTGPPWPPTFIERGLTVLAGIRVVNPIKMLQVVGEGGSGYFFEGEAEKVCVMRETTGSHAQNAASPAG